MKLLVTGASGFVGSHLCERLLADNHEVWGISRLTETARLADIQNKQNLHLLRCDIANFKEVRGIFSKNKFDAIFHTAACLFAQPTDDPFPYFEVNVKGTLNILQAAYLDKSASKIIYSSSMNVYGVAKYLPVDEHHSTEPVNVYGLTKLMGESFCALYARLYKFKTVILRYSGIFGPRRRGGAIYNIITKALRNEPPVIFSNGSDIWDTLHVKDVAAANLLALANVEALGFEIFNIGMGKGINVGHIANQIVNLVGSTARPNFGTAPVLPAFYYDISKSRNMLGFNPAPFTERLREYVEWEKHQSLKAKYKEG